MEPFAGDALRRVETLNDLSLGYAKVTVKLQTHRVRGITNSDRWPAEGAPARRRIVWQPADELTELAPPRDPPDSLSHPHWADGGTTRYPHRSPTLAAVEKGGWICLTGERGA